LGPFVVTVYTRYPSRAKLGRLAATVCARKAVPGKHQMRVIVMLVFRKKN